MEETEDSGGIEQSERDGGKKDREVVRNGDRERE